MISSYKAPILFIAILLVFSTRLSLAQSILSKGRILGQNMEVLEGVTIYNKNTSEKVNSDKQGIFSISTKKGDTLIFTFSKYSKDVRVIRKPSENVNMILIDRKARDLPPDYTGSERYLNEKAHDEDERVYRIINRGAEREGLWKY
jgi:hypothetical protein